MASFEKALEFELLQKTGFPAKPILSYSYRWHPIIERDLLVCSDAELGYDTVQAVAALAGDSCNRIDVYRAPTGALHCALHESGAIQVVVLPRAPRGI